MQAKPYQLVQIGIVGRININKIHETATSRVGRKGERKLKSEREFTTDRLACLITGEPR